MKLSTRASRIEPSVTLAMDALTNEMVRQGIDVVNFTVGQPDFDTPGNVKAKGIEAIESGFTKYTPAAGIPELREAVCHKLLRDSGLEYTPQEVVISVGAKHALYNIFQVLLDDGDEVIIPAPYWVSYLEQVRLAGGNPTVIEGTEAKGYKVTAQQIDEAVTPRTRALILNSPSNPSGAVYSRDELEDIARVAVKNHIRVISDEIYEPFTYVDSGHISIAQISPEVKALTLIVHGVSKSHSMTGWRIGYTIGDKAVIQAIAGLQSHSTSNPASMAQKAALEALEGPQDSVVAMVAEFRKRRDYVVQRLNALPGMRCTVPEGAFYVFPNVASLFGKRLGNEEIRDSYTFGQLLLAKARVALVPGNAFGAEGHVRISYATSMPRLAEGMNRIASLVQQLQ